VSICFNARLLYQPVAFCAALLADYDYMPTVYRTGVFSVNANPPTTRLDGDVSPSAAPHPRQRQGRGAAGSALVTAVGSALGGMLLIAFIAINSLGHAPKHAER